MDTELYSVMMDKLIESGLSKREFARFYNIPHAWFIEFMNPDKPFRPMQIKTQSLLMRELGIDRKLILAYNKYIDKERRDD